MKYIPFLSLLCSFSALAAIDCHEWSIVDQRPSHLTKNNSPVIQEVLQFIKEKLPEYTEEDKTELKLNGNHLGIEGVHRVFDFVLEELKTLRVLDLSFNKIEESHLGSVNNLI